MTRMGYVKHWANALGLHLGINRPGDGKTRYSFYVPHAGGGVERHIFTAVGIGQAEAFIEAYRECKRGTNPRKVRHQSRNPKGKELYKGYWIIRNDLNGLIWIEKDGYLIQYVKSFDEGRRVIDAMLGNPRRGARALMLQILPHGEVKGYVQKRKYRRKNPSAVTSIFGKAVKGWTPLAVGMPGMNPRQKLTKIYDKVLRVEAQKGHGHICDVKCKRAGHRYFHDFTSKPSMYGTPDKRVIIIK